MTALHDLVELLELEPIEVNIFRGNSPDENRQRVFGGQVAAQALMAAIKTVDTELPAHSLHSYFLRAGDPHAPILYEVDRIRDGRSFVTRRVVAIQHGRAIFNLQVSFQRIEQGYEYQLTMPEVPAAETLPNFETRMAPFRDEMGEWYDRPRPIDSRFVGQHPIERRRSKAVSDRLQVLFKAYGTLANDLAIHQCIATYASYMTLLDSTLGPHGLGWGEEVMMASLDHAMWFHRPFRADEWLLFDQQPLSTSGGRGLARGEIYTASGELVISAMQEGLIRPMRST